MHLAGFERRWAHAVLDTIFPGPSRGELPYGINDMDLDGFLDQILSTVPLEPAIGLRLAFWVIALAPLFVIGKFATITSLSIEDREKLLTKIAASNSYAIRSTIVAIKAVCSLFYCGDARLRPVILATSERADYVRLMQLRTPEKSRDPRSVAQPEKTPSLATPSTKESIHEQHPA